MPTLNEGRHAGEFIGELAMGQGYHCDAITVGSGNLLAGTVLSLTRTGTPTAAAGTPVSGSGGTVGNGVVSAVSADAGAMPGTWIVEFVAASANAGTFQVRRPDGSLATPATGVVGTPYNGTNGINFTIADGATDWSVRDSIPIVVTYPGDQLGTSWVQYDGTLPVAGVLIDNTNATAAAQPAVALVRGPAMVNRNDLVWFTNATAAQIARGISELMALGIKAV
jgi:hypothetical protein